MWSEAFPSGAIVWFITPYPRGILMAHLDGWRGHDEVLRYGLPMPPTVIFPKLLQLVLQFVRNVCQVF